MHGTIIEKQGTTLTVSPQGQLDAYSSPVLEKELQPYLDQAEEIIMDFTNVEYISSNGLRVLLAAEQKLEERNGKVKLIHVNEQIVDVLRMVGFMDIVDVERD